MVKVTGPMLSQAAAGKIGESLIYSVNKGRAYVKKHTAPKQPKTGKQIGMRAIFAYLSKMWTTLSPAEKTTWQQLAALTNIAPFNAWQSYNTARYRDFWPPSIEHPAAKTALPDNVPVLALTANIRSVKVTITPAAAQANWGYLICRRFGANFTPTYQYGIAFVEADGVNAVTYLDTPLTAGTWRYKIGGFTVDGTWTPFSLAQAAIIP